MRQLKESLAKDNLNHISLHDAIIRRDRKNPGNAYEFNIIFPKAPWGDLLQFIQGGWSYDFETYDLNDRFQEMATEGTNERARQLLEQCRGIADALNFLHSGFQTEYEPQKVVCAHMDLKPDNIIIFAQGPVGLWKICDFGISVVRPESEMRHKQNLGTIRDYEETKTMRTEPKRGEGAGTYVPPEMHDGRTPSAKKMAGRRSDIWSFGAVFSEIFAFAADGPNGREKFREARMEKLANDLGGTNTRFYRKVQSNSPSRLPPPHLPVQSATELAFEVKPRVFEWLENKVLNTDGDPVPWRREWVECIKGMLEVEVKNRPRSEDVLKGVEGVLQTASAPQIGDNRAGPRVTDKEHDPIRSHPKSWLAETSTQDGNEYAASGSTVYPPVPHPPTGSDTSVPGHGIPRLNRRPLRGIEKLDVDSRDFKTTKQVAVNDEYVAYLSENHLRIFAISAAAGEFLSEPVIKTLPKRTSWTNLALSGSYIAITGKDYSGKPKVAPIFPVLPCGRQTYPSSR